MLDGVTQHGIVGRPSIVADISFVDPNDGQRMPLVRAGGPETDDSVVQQQIDRFADPCCGQSAKEQCCGSQDAALE